MDLNNKVVVVTGAGRGLGRGIAEALASRGARIVCVDLNEDDLRDTVARCARAGGEAKSYLANVAREDEVTALFDGVVADFGALHGLVNNAGITRDGLLVKFKDGELQSSMSLQQWQAVIDVNLTGVFLCGREAARCMLESGVEEGVIVNISGVIAEQNLPGMAAYGASKAAVASFDEALAREARRAKVRVIDARPPHTETGLADRAIEGQAPRMPEGLSPETVAKVIAEAIDGDGAVLGLGDGRQLGRVLRVVAHVGFPKHLHVLACG